MRKVAAAWGVAIVCATLGACGGDGGGSGKVSGLVASVDLADRVELTWTASGAAPQTFRVLRDGEAIASLRGDARVFTDRGAAAGRVEPALLVQADEGGLDLGWEPPAREPGAVHRYELVATYGKESTTVEAEGGRAAPAVQGYRIVRDEVTLVSLPASARSFRDEGVEAGTLGAAAAVGLEVRDGALVLSWDEPEAFAGPAHRYRLVVVAEGVDEARSSEVEAGRSAPVVTGYRVLRDGGWVATLPASSRRLEERDVAGGSWLPPMFSASPGVDAVDLAWTARAIEGLSHGFQVEALWSKGAGPVSEAVSGARPPPAIEGWIVSRDGVEVARLASSASSFRDAGAAPVEVDAPAELNATRGTRADGVALSWTPTLRFPEHRYELVAMATDVELAAAQVSGGRSAPAITYEVQRDDGPWRDAGAATVFVDREAPPAIPPSEMEALAISDRYRGFVELRLAEEWDFEPEVSPIYRVRPRTADGPGPAASTTGYRGMDLEIRWQRSLDDSPMDFVDLPMVSGLIAYDLEAEVDVGRYYRAKLLDGGTLVGHSTPSWSLVHGFLEVGAGWGFGCGLRSLDRKVVCWRNDSETGGQLPSADAYETMSVGQDRVCGVRRSDQAALCWGSSMLPGDWDEPVVEAPGTFQSVSAGSRHFCGVRTDGVAVCWGDNRYGQATAPVGTGFRSVSAGWWHSCGVRTDGRVVCWGDNMLGEAPGLPTVETYLSVSAGYSHSCGLLEDGRIRCWGLNDFGQAPGVVGPDAYESVSTGRDQSCGVRAADQRVVCWGRNGVGDAPAGPSVERFTQVSSGNLHGCGRRVDSKLRCWGATHALPSVERYAQVSAGDDHFCAVRRDDGAVVCGGLDSSGQAPRRPSEESFQRVSAGGAHSCGIHSADGSLSCWGRDDLGQVSGAPADSYSAVSAAANYGCAIRALDGRLDCWGNYAMGWAPVPSLEALDVGFSHGCGVRREDHQVSCWGSNFFGEASPPAGVAFASVAAGGNFSCGLEREDHALICWGGDATRLVPDPPEADGYLSLSAGVEHACAVRRSDGRVICRGVNDQGEAPPTPSRDAFESVSAGKSFTCGIRAVDQRLLCWGGNQFGQAPFYGAIE